MKWIGQHIYDLISRFRNDVYLEDISTGTIASGGNLGLDSNNKIVKANEVTGDITRVQFTADTTESISQTTGNADFTISGGNAIGTDINDSTGAIEINHDDTSSQASVNNSGSTFIQDVTIDTYGHVTGLTSAAVPTLNQDTTGNAATATALETSRNLQVDLSSTSAQGFTGAANAIEIGVNGTLAAGNGGTGATSITALKNLLDDETWTFANNITGTLATAAQTNITSLGTLTGLTVDDIGLDAKTIRITGDTDDYLTITSTDHGASTFTTIDNAGTNGHLTLDADGNVVLDTAVGSANNGIVLNTGGTQFGDFNVHHSKSYFTLYEAGGASLVDYFDIAVAANGATSITTVDAAGTDANLNFAIDGTFSIASTGIDIATNGTITNAVWQGDVIATTYTAAKVTSIVAGDGIDVSGATGDVTVTAETATDSNPGVVELATTGEADTGTDTARAVTPAGLKSHVDLRYAYAYMTWSASAVSSLDGSGETEWVFPNIAKGIYEEDWTKDENITAVTPGTTQYSFTRQSATNSLVVPHTGICVGFHAHGRNNGADTTFKAGLFHFIGSTTGGTNATGIDYGASGSNNEATLRWVATANEAEASGGTDGTGGDTFKGPCKLVSNTDALTVNAGDGLLPAIMGPNDSNEIFVTMTIILKIPLTT